MRRPKKVFPSLLLTAMLCSLGCEPEKSIKFGVALPLTGSAGVYGESLRKGAELGFEALQADESFDYTVEIEIVDTESDPQKAAEVAAELYSSSIAVVGGVTSAEALAMVAVARDREKVLLSPSASSPELTRSARGFFRIFPTALTEASAMANFAQERLKVTTMAVIAEEGPFGESLRDSLRQVFQQQGGTVEAAVQYPAGTTDFAAFVEEALAGEPEGVYIAADGKDLPAILSALEDERYGRSVREGETQIIMTTSALSHPKLIAEAGHAANGVYLTQTVYDDTSEEGRMPEFVAAYEAKYGEKPDYYAAHGYDTMLVLGAAAMKMVTVLDSEMVKGMRSIEPVEGVTGTIQFNEGGDAQKFPRIHRVVEGEVVDFTAHFEAERDRILKEMQRLREQIRRQQQQSGSGS